jgi:hypothetical protein
MGGMAQIRYVKLLYPPDHPMARLRYQNCFLTCKHLFARLQEDLNCDAELGLYKYSACDILNTYDASDIQRERKIGSTGTHALNQG